MARGRRRTVRQRGAREGGRMGEDMDAFQRLIRWPKRCESMVVARLGRLVENTQELDTTRQKTRLSR